MTTIYIIVAVCACILLPICVFGMIFLEYLKQIRDISLSLHKMIRVLYEDEWEIEFVDELMDEEDAIAE